MHCLLLSALGTYLVQTCLGPVHATLVGAFICASVLLIWGALSDPLSPIVFKFGGTKW